jgi:Glycosyl hydrolases family 16
VNAGPRYRWLNIDVAKASILAVAATVITTSCGVIATINADSDSPAARCTTTAAEQHGWGDPVRQDDFGDASSLANWHLYSGPGHAGNGRRTPTAITIEDDAVVIKGNAQGYSGGMGWDAGQMFGRWEVCSKSPPAAPGYHSLLLLWPDAEDWPVGGEIDFMEIVDPTRQSVEGWLHYGPDDQRIGGTVSVDATQWHAWAVEWTPERVTLYLDGKPRWTTTDKATFPPRPMHLCLQVDNFGGDIAAGGQQMIDWTRQYRLT